MIHPGEYNILKVWDYAGLANSLSNGDGTTFAVKVRQSFSCNCGLDHFHSV